MSYMLVIYNLYFDYNLDMHNIIVRKCEKVLEIYFDEKSSFKDMLMNV